MDHQLSIRTELLYIIDQIAEVAVGCIVVGGSTALLEHDNVPVHVFERFLNGRAAGALMFDVVPAGRIGVGELVHTVVRLRVLPVLIDGATRELQIRKGQVIALCPCDLGGIDGGILREAVADGEHLFSAGIRLLLLLAAPQLELGRAGIAGRHRAQHRDIADVPADFHIGRGVCRHRHAIRDQAVRRIQGAERRRRVHPVGICRIGCRINGQVVSVVFAV